MEIAANCGGAGRPLFQCVGIRAGSIALRHRVEMNLPSISMRGVPMGRIRWAERLPGFSSRLESGNMSTQVVSEAETVVVSRERRRQPKSCS
ncbi:hypothetical protein chiPu_0003637 [Chiloscyllium punctatum]|uniref:Uncharacterized protein n=1 Tax=Chiloscyllium punctatum TaxID=137246 RepID=A0A401S4G2_CHIPU|nr:hypothetical protein [Chiloscyllium punctatum]